MLETVKMSVVVMGQVDGVIDSSYAVDIAGDMAVGHSFTGNGGKITQANFFLETLMGVIGGQAKVEIYAHSGTWGSNGVPLGSPLATSESLDVSGFVADWVVFNFLSGSQFQTVAGSKYFVVLRGESISVYGSGAAVRVFVTTVSFNGGNSVVDDYGSWDPSYVMGHVLFQVLGTSVATFSVVYNGNGATGGGVPVDNNFYVQSVSVIVAANSGGLVKSGYNFIGWATTSGASTPTFAVTGLNVNPPSFNMPASNVTLYAVWQQISTCTVTYNGNGNTSGAVPLDSSSPYLSGLIVTVLGNSGSLVKLGYRFLGWNTNSSATTAQYVVGNTFTINSNTTLYAVWKQIFTLTYNGNGNTGGSVPPDSNSPYDTGATVTVLGNLGNLVKTNYTFLGWSTSNSATVAQYTQGSTFTINSNTMLYAVWSSAGGGFDGGVINSSLEVKCKFPSLLETWADLSVWMNASAGSLPDYSAFLRFTNINTPPALSTDIYGIAFKDGNNNYVAGVGINDSLLVRKNLYAKTAGIGTLTVPTKLQVNAIESFTGQPIKVKAVTAPNEDEKWVDLQPIRFSMESTLTQYDDFTVLQIGKGGLQFLDTGGILTVIPNPHGFPTALGTKPEHEPITDPQTGVVNLFCTRIRPTDRINMTNDPVLMVDKAFYVEKDFNTFGYVGTTSDPHKGSGGAAILMSQGFIGPYCPPWFNLIGLMNYPAGDSFPSSENTFKKQWFYKTADSQGFPHGLYRYVNQGTDQNPNYQWILQVECDRFGSYPSGPILPNTGDNNQYLVVS